MLASLPITHPIAVPKASCRPFVPHRRPLRTKRTPDCNSLPVFCATRASAQAASGRTATHTGCGASRRSGSRRNEHKVKAQAVEPDYIDVDGQVVDMRIPVTVYNLPAHLKTVLLNARLGCNYAARQVKHCHCSYNSWLLLHPGDYRIPGLWQNHFVEQYPHQKPRQAYSCDRK